MKFSHATAMAALGVASMFAACGTDGASSIEPSSQATPRQASISTGAHTLEGNGGEKVTSQRAQTTRAQGQASSQGPEHNADELNGFATDGTKILSSATGNLNGDGKPDALVVLDTKSENKEPGDRAPRTVLLLIRDTNGSLREIAKNNKIVPCSKCGGILGDPFGYMRIEKNGFVIVIEGGSRWRWSSEYTFKYVANVDNWQLQKVDRGAYDSISQQNVSRTFTPDDFGKISFSDFDPSSILEIVQGLAPEDAKEAGSIISTGAMRGTTNSMPTERPGMSQALLIPRLKKGMVYSDLRSMLLADKWLPIANPDCMQMVVGDNHIKECKKEQAPDLCRICAEFPEVEACSTDGYCYVAFSKGRKNIHIKIYGDILETGNSYSGSDPVVMEWH